MVVIITGSKACTNFIRGVVGQARYCQGTAGRIVLVAIASKHIAALLPVALRLLDPVLNIGSPESVGAKAGRTPGNCQRPILPSYSDIAGGGEIVRLGGRGGKQAEGAEQQREDGEE